MSHLDEVLDAFLETKKAVFENGASKEDCGSLIEALKEKKKSEIVKEIREEYKDELKKEIIKENEKETIKALKTLMIEGFFIAFFVGLAINQVTEILGFFKKTITTGSLAWTVFFSVVLLAVCVAIYLYSFLSRVLDILRSFDKD